MLVWLIHANETDSSSVGSIRFTRSHQIKHRLDSPGLSRIFDSAMFGEGMSRAKRDEWTRRDLNQMKTVAHSVRAATSRGSNPGVNDDSRRSRFCSRRKNHGLAGAPSIRVPAEARVERLPNRRGVEFIMYYSSLTNSRRISIFSRSVRSS
jgi:hypothetical protein